MSAAELLREDWNGGAIDAARWLVASRSSSVIELVELGDGDRALALWDSQTTAKGRSIANVSVNSRSIFPRGHNLRIGFLAWWDKERPKATANPSVFTAGWHASAFEAASYFNNEAVVNPGGATTFDENRTRSHVPLLDQDEFKQAWVAATAKDRALKLRILLGDETGAAMEWYDGEKWRSAIDTRGADVDGSPYTRNASARPDDFGSPLAMGRNVSHAPWARIAFQPYEGWLLVDDVVVENDQSEAEAWEAMSREAEVRERASGKSGGW